jgi:hypothetical protein
MRMKTGKKLMPFCALLVINFISCKKDKEKNEEICPIIETTATIYADYSKLKVGNYWIYQRYELDSLGNETVLNVIDSCYVKSDTLINGNTYFVVCRPGYNPSNTLFLLRDSLNYIISFGNYINFSSQDFTSIFDSYYITASASDTVCYVVKKMASGSTIVTVPAGTFTTLDAQETFNMYPNWSFAGAVRKTHTRYAENIGIVSETLPFFSSNPKYIERRLIRYKVN